MGKFSKVFLAFTLVILILVGCGKEDSENEGGVVNVEFWHSLGGINGEATDDLVDLFNETVGKEKNIKVTSVYQGDDVTEKLKTVAQANDTKNFPDVGLIYGGGIPSVVNLDQLVPIEDLYEEGNIVVPKEDLEENAARAFSYQDRLIGMPFNTSTILFYYNKDMFQEVGIDPEQPPQTIGEMAEYIDKLMIKDGEKIERYGLNVNVRRYQLANWIGGQGEFNFFGDNEGGRSNQMTKVTFGEDGSLRKYLTEWEKVIKTGGYKEIEDNINEEFASELFGMAIMSTSRLQTIKELTKDKFDYGVAPLPKVDAEDTGGASVGGGSLTVFDRGNAEVVQAAWEFVQFTATPEAQLIFHKQTGYIPVNKKIYDLDEMKTHLEENPEYQVAIEQLHDSHKNVQEPFDIINWEIDEIIRTSMVEFAQGKLTLEETHDAIVDQSNEKLAAYTRANN